MANLNIKQDSVLIRPHVTEKAAVAAERGGVYTFEVKRDATTGQVVASIRNAYKVIPVKVRLLAIPTKRVFVRGKWGTKGGGKKAYVYLKKGDKIEVM